LGEFVAPRFNDFRENAKRRIQGATISSEFRSGLWAKDVLRDPVTKQITGSRFLNAGKVELSGELRSVWVYEVDNQMRLMTLITAEEAHFLDNNRWRLDRVKEMRFVRDAGQRNSGQSAIITQYKFDSSLLESEITPEIMAVLISDPSRMSALDLIVFTKHLEENRQRTDRYDIALWTKLFVSACSVCDDVAGIAVCLSSVAQWRFVTENFYRHHDRRILSAAQQPFFAYRLA
jgi:lipopolysaccharide export system permease protein